MKGPIALSIPNSPNTQPPKRPPRIPSMIFIIIPLPDPLNNKLPNQPAIPPIIKNHKKFIIPSFYKVSKVKIQMK